MQILYMVNLKNIPCNSALFGLVIFHDPCLDKDIYFE